MRKRVWLSAVIVLAVLGGLLLSVRATPSGAWPWQQSTSVHLTGEVTCKDFDVSGETRIPFARVEGFEIRGRSGVLRSEGMGYEASYATDVPVGWKVEYSVKCSSDHRWHDSSGSESFIVAKKAVGDTTNQKRNICFGGGIFEPCVERDLGACVTFLIEGQIQTAMTFEKAFAKLYDKFGSKKGTLLSQCVDALGSALPKADQQPKPNSIPTASQMPQPKSSTLEPLPKASTSPSAETKPTKPGSASTSTDHPTKRPESVESSPPSEPGSSGAVLTVYNKVTDGDSMREDTPAYLSDTTQNYCRKSGCMLANTDMGSGDQITAICQRVGDRTTNGQDDSSGDDGNASLFQSTRWYGIRWSDGRMGYLSEVWTAEQDRGGRGLPTC